MKTSVFIYSMIILVFASCKQDPNADGSADASDTTAVAAMEIATPMPSSYKEAKYSTAQAASLKNVDKEEVMEPKIIKSGELKFQSDDLEVTYNQIQNAVKKYNASIKSDYQQNDDEAFSRSVNIRIPNENFDAFITDISKGVSYFDRKDITSQDVTEEYIDVASRIKTKKVLEERYLELLKKATKVSEMLEIEGQLSEIREEIEAKEGRLQYLKNKVAMSTLDIEFYKPRAVGTKATVSYGGRIGNAIVSGFNSISNFFISLLGIWPVIVTLVALFVLIRKRFKRKNKQDVLKN